MSYADLAIDEGVGGWCGRTDVSYGLSPIALKEPKKCRQCGKGHLFWAKSEGRWKLHHWAMLETDRAPRFILHRCGFTSEGKPVPALRYNTEEQRND